MAPSSPKDNPLMRTEDWWAVWLGAILLLVGAVVGLAGPGQVHVPRIPKWTWDDFGALLHPPLALSLILLLVGLCALCMAAVSVMARRPEWKFIPGFVSVFALAAVSFLVASEVEVRHWGLAYAFWAVGLGLLIANTVGAPAWMKQAIRAEFYIKTGLVLLGFEILFIHVLRFGAYGLAIAWGVTPVVIVFMWLFGTRILGMTNKALVIVIAAATSVCGVSAAVAAAAASGAKREDLTLAVGMTLIFTVAMMVGMPILVGAMGLSPLVGGAWLGGTIDATGAVVAAGAVLGPEAEMAAAIVKMIQNILIGLVAFAIALYWVLVVERKQDARRLGIGEVWRRMPKFILGFLAASLVASFLASPLLGSEGLDAVMGQTKALRGWLFCMAFVSIGLDSNLKEMAAQMTGGRPIVLYLVGQSFNVALTLLVVWLVLSGRFFPPPPMLAQ